MGEINPATAVVVDFVVSDSGMYRCRRSSIDIDAVRRIVVYTTFVDGDVVCVPIIVDGDAGGGVLHVTSS